MFPDQFAEFFAQDEEVKGPFDFPPEVNDDVQGLRHLGFLTETVEFCGHEFVLKTLNADEEIAAAIASKHAKGTVKEVESWMKAVVGMAISNVDGEEDFCPPTGPDLEAYAKARYRYTGRWFYPTIDYLYNQYVGLMRRQVDAVRAFQDFSSRNLGPVLPLPGFLTEPGASNAQTSGATPASD